LQVEKEQLKGDLKIARQKLDEEIVEGQKRILDVAAQQRALCAKDLEEMQTKVRAIAWLVDVVML